VGSEEGGKMQHYSERGGVIGARSGFRRKKTPGWLIGWARQSVKRRWRGRLGQKGGEREAGHSWAKRGRERGGPRLGRKPKMDG
jgi:hypothetical protein